MPIILFCVIIFVLWLHYESSKSTNTDRTNSEAFWKKESEANNTRKVDITTLPYISIPINELPIIETEDVTLNAFQVKIIELSNQKIINLTGLSNTDLKLQYGASNLTILSKYDQNYTLLVRTLNEWATYLYDQNKVQDAKTILEFAILCRSDIKSTYVLLSTIYISSASKEKIHKLLEVAQGLNSLSKSSILDALNDML